MNNQNGSANTHHPDMAATINNRAGTATEPLLAHHGGGSDVNTEAADTLEAIAGRGITRVTVDTPSSRPNGGRGSRTNNKATNRDGAAIYTNGAESHSTAPIAASNNAKTVKTAAAEAGVKKKSGGNSNDNRRDSKREDARSSRTTAGTDASRGPITMATPPDGGWGWVVVFSSFAISMLVDGVCFSFGIFFDEFRNEFGTSKAATSWIGSVLNGTYLLIGPIVSALVNVYGCRRVAMSGAVIASCAFFISTYSKTLGVLIFTYGFMGGFGFGLMYLPAIVMVGYYFERRRALATGIACCGSGMGAFIFAPFSEILIDEYGWRGATWIVSGLVLNGLLFALFYRPLPEPRTAFSYADVDTTDSDSSLVMPSEMAPWIEPGQSPSGVPSIFIEEVDNVKTFMSGKTGKAAPSAPISHELKTQIVDLLHTEKKVIPRQRTRSVTLEEVSCKNDLSRLARSQDFEMTVRKRQDGHNVDGNSKLNLGKGKPFGSSHAVGKSLQLLHRSDIFYSGSLMHLKELHDPNSMVSEQEQQQMSDKSANHSAYDDFSVATNSPSAKSFSVAISSVFDLSLLKSPTFLVYGSSCFLCMLGFFVPFVYMPAHAIDLGLGSRNAAFLISIIGITNTLGRVGVGFVSDQPWADCLLINNVALMIGGTSTMFVPYLPSYVLLAVYAAVFGTSVAVFVSLRSIIMVELMGLERLTTAFGLVIMCQGMSAFLGAPIAGILSDHYGNYDAAFYLAGVSLTLSGLICVPLRRIARWETERNRKRDARILAELNETSAHEQIDGVTGGPNGLTSSLKGSNMKKGSGRRVTVDSTGFGSEVDAKSYRA